MPFFLYCRRNSLDTSASSAGTTRSAISMMVTGTLKLLNTDANSTPTAPEPMTISDFGSLSSERISMLVRILSLGL